MNLIIVAGVPSRFREFKVLELATDPDAPDSLALESKWEDALESLKENKYTIHDGENLTRAERTKKYREAKKMGAKVSILMVYASLQALKEDYDTPPDKLSEQYLMLEPPRIGLDCDIISIEGEQFFAGETMESLYLSENDFANAVVSDGIMEEVDSTSDELREDISLMIEDSHSSFLKFLSFFANVGKGFAPDNWNSVGANYVLNALYFSSDKDVRKIASFDLVEAVLYQDSLSQFEQDSSLYRVLNHYQQNIKLTRETV